MDGESHDVTPSPERPVLADTRSRDVLQTSLRLLQMIDTADVDAIIQTGLEESVRLSESRIGYLHFVNPDQQTIRLHTWSTGTLAICTAVEDTHYPLAEAGVWVDCIHRGEPVVHNDYASLPHKKGLPSGHVPVVRDLSVPVFEDGDIVAVLGVGNKEGDYGNFDVELVSLLAETIWSVVRRRRSHENLHEQVAARTADLKHRNGELTAALAHIDTLHGILPICSHCKQIRDDQGYWNQLEAYLSAHSQARFSHGICPACLKLHYAEFGGDDGVL